MANIVLIYLSGVLVFFLLDLQLVLPLLDALLKLLQPQICLLNWLNILTAGLDSLVESTHLQFTQGFVVEKASVTALEWEPLVANTR